MYRGDDGKPWVLPVVRKVNMYMCDRICEKNLVHAFNISKFVIKLAIAK